MIAYFLIKNQQFSGKVGDILYVDKINSEIGETILFKDILIIGEEVGYPFVKDSFVECKVLKHGKNKKIRVLKFISQKRHRKVTGFRKEYTKLEITTVKKK